MNALKIILDYNDWPIVATPARNFLRQLVWRTLATLGIMGDQFGTPP